MKRVVKGFPMFARSALALAAVVGAASPALALECRFPFPQVDRECRAGSIAARGTLELDPVEGYHLEVDYRSGEIGAEAIAIGPNGEQLLVVADTAQGDQQVGLAEFQNGVLTRVVPFSDFYDSASDPSEIFIAVF